MFAKSFILALAAASAAQAAIFARQNPTPPGYPCNRDNCLRSMVKQEDATRLPKAIEDCKSYFWSTETPATATVTATATDTSTTTLLVVTTSVTTYVQPVMAKRDLASSQLPVYAQTACQGSFSRWSSVCSCLGVTSTTITLATPSTSVTVTTTDATVTVTSATATVTPLAFRLRRFTPSVGSNNQYVYVDASDRLFYPNAYMPAFTIPYFQLDEAGHLFYGAKQALVPAPPATQPVSLTFYDPSTLGTPYICSIAPNSYFACGLTTTPSSWAGVVSGPDRLLQVSSTGTLVFKAQN